MFKFYEKYIVFTKRCFIFQIYKMGKLFGLIKLSTKVGLAGGALYAAQTSGIFGTDSSKTSDALQKV